LIQPWWKNTIVKDCGKGQSIDGKYVTCTNVPTAVCEKTLKVTGLTSQMSVLLSLKMCGRYGYGSGRL
jgi:hypothetical protein